MMSAAAVARERACDRLCELAAHVHAAHGELAVMAAEVDATDAWAGDGYRSCAHWLTVTTGLDEHSARELLRVGHALRELPLLRAASAAGRLSLDKLRAVTRVAAPADDGVWVEVALHANGSQLLRICRAYMRAGRDDTAEARSLRRGVWARWTDDGMLDLRAVLTAEDGGVVLGAIEAVARRDAEERAGAADAGQDPADDPRAAARADALVGVCESVVSDAAGTGSASAHRVVVHVDAATLLGDDTPGRCHVEDGAGLPPSVARRLGCDTELVAAVERDGQPLGVGRARRLPSGRLRCALQLRDRWCRFPGCGVPASRTHSHHVVHWIDGGPTELANLVSLCGFHHRRVHEGAFSVVRDSGGSFRFSDARGATLGKSETRVVTAAGAGDLRPLLPTTEAITARSPFARSAGERLDLGYAIEVLHHGCARRRELVGAGPPEPHPSGDDLPAG